jgi:hypothetical protein
MAVAQAYLEACPTSVLHPLEHKFIDALIIQASVLSANENSRTVDQDNNEFRNKRMLAPQYDMGASLEL